MNKTKKILMNKKSLQLPFKIVSKSWSIAFFGYNKEMCLFRIKALCVTTRQPAVLIRNVVNCDYLSPSVGC